MPCTALYHQLLLINFVSVLKLYGSIVRSAETTFASHLLFACEKDLKSTPTFISLYVFALYLHCIYHAGDPESGQQ